MRTVFLTPIGASSPRNGLAHRAAEWKAALASISDVVTVVVPVAGPSSDPSELVVGPDPDERIDVPRLARGCTTELGRRVGGRIGRADVVVCFRSYLADVGSGLAEATGAALLVDLDDDDEAFFAQTGEPDEARRFGELVARARSSADLVVAAVPGFGDIDVPNAVAIPPVVDRRPTSSVLMVGNFRYAPNVEGATWLIDEVLPLVRDARPDVVLDVVGPGSERFGGPGVVDDLGGSYSAAGVAVVPIRSGSGTRVKAIEAWAHGVPMVATSAGVEGLGATDGVDVVVADDAASFAAAVVGLLDRPDEAERLGAAGRATASQRFAAATVGAAMGELVTGLVGTATWNLESAGGFDVSEVDDGLVLVNAATGAVHHLNPTAAGVYAMADGSLDEAGIAREFATALDLDEPPVDVVGEAVAMLVGAGVLRRRRAG